MQLLLFTKIFTGCSPDEVGEAAQALGFAGLDLAVRQGQCIEPATVRATLPAAIKLWSGQGLTVPLLTLEGDFTDPTAQGVEDMFIACHENGIPFVKLGYWRYKAGHSYNDEVAAIRRALAGFQKLGERYGVCSLVHTHAGGMYGGNASAARVLVEDCNANYVALYLDPAHQALEGETDAMALAIAGEYLRLIGVKNARYVPQVKEDRTVWQSEWCPLDEGLVDWPSTLAAIRASGYTGLLSFHATYSAARDQAGALHNTARDLEYLRPLLK